MLDSNLLDDMESLLCILVEDFNRKNKSTMLLNIIITKPLFKIEK